MASPEQQPTSEPEKNLADTGLDIDAAKKYLEEAYGPGKSSIIVDKSTPIPEKQEIKESRKITDKEHDDYWDPIIKRQNEKAILEEKRKLQEGKQEEAK